MNSHGKRVHSAQMVSAQGCERWRPIPEYRFRYEISDRGNIRRVATMRGTFVGKRLSVGQGSDGVRKVALWREGARVTVCVHLVMALVFLGPTPAGKIVALRDGDPANLTIKNLCYRKRGWKGGHGRQVGTDRPG